MRTTTSEVSKNSTDMPGRLDVSIEPVKIPSGLVRVRASRRLGSIRARQSLCPRLGHTPCQPKCTETSLRFGPPILRAYQLLVDLTATMARLPGRLCRCPRRALSPRHVSPRQPNYVVDALVFLRSSTADHKHDLAFHVPRKLSGGLLRCSSEDLLVELRKLPAHGDRGSGRKIPQRLPEPLWGLEEHKGGRLGGDTLQSLRAHSSLTRQEAGKDDRVGRQPRGHERRSEGRGAGEGFYLDAGLDAGAHKPVSRIGDERGACVGDEGYALRLRPFGQFGSQAFLVVFVVGDEVLVYLVVEEQSSCAPGVLAGNEVGLAQVAEGAEGDVLQVAYGGWNHGEGHLSAAKQVLSGGCVPGERCGAEDAGLGTEGGYLDVGQVA